MKRLSLRFGICNWIYGDELRQLLAFELIDLENILKYVKVGDPLCDYWMEKLVQFQDELSILVYGVDSAKLEYDTFMRVINRNPTRKFRFCNIFYFGELKRKLDRIIGNLHIIFKYLKTQQYLYDSLVKTSVYLTKHDIERILY